MNTPTREDLLGFVLGALDAQEHQQVVDCLNLRPDLQLELQRIKAQLDHLFNPEPTATVDFPVGLARRTCEVVSRESRQPTTLAVTLALHSKFTRAVQSAIMVCSAALLGAVIGPIAYGALISNSQPTAASLVVCVAPGQSTAETPAAPSSAVAFMGQSDRKTSLVRENSSLRGPAHFFPIKRNYVPAIQFISK